MEKTPSINVEITSPQKGDYLEIMNVYEKTWLETYPNTEIGITREDIIEYFKEKDLEENKKRFDARLTSPGFSKTNFVAKINKKIVGVCQISFHENHNHINSLYVLPKYQKQGVGKKLMQNALKVLGEVKPITIALATYNNKAKIFYESFGFRDNGRRFDEERHRMPISKVKIPEMEMEKKFEF